MVTFYHGSNPVTLNWRLTAGLWYNLLMTYREDSINPVHIDAREIIEENGMPTTVEELGRLLEFAWNRGYKKGYDAADQFLIET